MNGDSGPNGSYVRNQYTEMICAAMKRITAECTNVMATPQDIAILMTSYADLVRATSGGGGE